MRRLLDALYDGAAALAAIAMVGLLVAVLLSVVSRQLGFNVQGVDSYAGFLLAAAGFLSLAHTLKRGEHIRVTLLVNAVPPRLRRALEIWTLVAGTLLAGLFAFYSAKLAWQSHEFNDVSTGTDATPLWIPQLAMVVGALVLLIAMLDDLVLELRGQRVLPATEEPLRNE
ncbi:TRAP transporter small permease [Ideonella sp. BN130291]|uniref:TRAP transporter small permease n=1 Tax=Ideonella sp. BN130291 TaxID=3112940 RepID=UPI002E25D3F1|nr:TRAP transporter small permease [Ideonella sp. BN130291]